MCFTQEKKSHLLVYFRYLSDIYDAPKTPYCVTYAKYY